MIIVPHDLKFRRTKDPLPLSGLDEWEGLPVLNKV
jgi:hypothetical protein